MRVRAYRNLNCKAGLVQWSIYSEQLRCVIGHCDAAYMTGAGFVVDQSAQRYMKDVLKKRWVVGWVAGELLSTQGLRPAGRTERGRAAFGELVDLEGMLQGLQPIAGLDVSVRFDPWTMDQFQDRATGKPVSGTCSVQLMADGGCWCIGPIEEAAAC